MATDIGSLASGLDGHGLALGDGNKGLRKNEEILVILCVLGAVIFPT
jgi:hypothetical protein